MRNECFKKKTLSLRSGVPYSLIVKAMLVDRALDLWFSTREIKLNYNIFTNIMTHMSSNVKIYSL